MILNNIRSCTLASAIVLGLTACGGGGSSNSGNGSVAASSNAVVADPGSAAAPIAVSLNRTLLAMSYVSGTSPASPVVTATLSSFPRVDVFPVVVADKAVIKTGTQRITPNSDGSFSLSFVAEPSLAPGRYEGSLSLHLCRDPACSSELSLTGATLAYRFDVTAAPVVTAPVLLSQSQLSYETLLKSDGGAYSLHWKLESSGHQTANVDYAASSFVKLAQSPSANVAQVITPSTRVNLISSLPLFTFKPKWVLRNGNVLTVPAAGAARSIRYAGSQVQADTLAADNTTVAYTESYDQISTTPLSGQMLNAPVVLRNYYHAFFANPLVLDATQSFAPGASYTYYTATAKGDRYLAFDCHDNTVNNLPQPCFANRTLSATLTAGISSTSDARTYHLADGVISNVGGIDIWVASSTRPITGDPGSPVQNRIYFSMGGNVYTGALVRDGAVINGSNYNLSGPGGPISNPYYILLNKAARDSIAAAMRP